MKTKKNSWEFLIKILIAILIQKRAADEQDGKNPCEYFLFVPFNRKRLAAFQITYANNVKIVSFFRHTKA